MRDVAYTHLCIKPLLIVTGMWIWWIFVERMKWLILCGILQIFTWQYSLFKKKKAAEKGSGSRFAKCYNFYSIQNERWLMYVYRIFEISLYSIYSHTHTRLSYFTMRLWFYVLMRQIVNLLNAGTTGLCHTPATQLRFAWSHTWLAIDSDTLSN